MPTRFLPRFSLRTLLVLVLFLGSGGLLRVHWEPWYLAHILAVQHAGWASATFSPDDSRVASSGSDGIARVWDASNGSFLTEVSGKGVGLSPPAWSPSGSFVATSDVDGQTAIWTTANGCLLAELSSHQGKVYHRAFSADEQYLATMGADGVARVWSINRRQLVREIPGIFRNSKFSPNGEYLITNAYTEEQHWGIENGTAVPKRSHCAVKFLRPKFRNNSAEDHLIGNTTSR
jgi:WD40 repeat protein